MKAIIDGDLIAYPCAATCKEDDPLEVALQRTDNLVREILQQTQAAEYCIYLSTKSNFRKEVAPEYKANRKDQEPPHWLQQCKEYLLTEWNAKVKEYYEADDLLGMAQGEDTLLCGFDKDLLQVPGNHFNWRRQTYQTVSELGGLQFFYKQMLIGDKTDNVIGIAGLGPVKAGKLIDPLDDEQEMFDLVYNKYNNPEQFLLNGICLWICRKEGVTWAHHLKERGLIIPSELEPVVEAKLECMKSFMEII